MCILKTPTAGHRRTPYQLAGPVWALGRIAAMISAVNSTCGAEAEPAAEEDAETEAEAGGVRGRNNCSQFSHRGSEASAVWKVLAITFAANSTCCCFYVWDKRRSKGGNAEAEAEKIWRKRTHMPKHGTKSVIKYRASLSPFLNASFSWIPRTGCFAWVLSQSKIWNARRHSRHFLMRVSRGSHDRYSAWVLCEPKT